jgi:ribose transport system ATP-binding protein
LNNADRILVFNNGTVTRELAGPDRTRFNLYSAAYEAA